MRAAFGGFAAFFAASVFLFLPACRAVAVTLEARLEPSRGTLWVGERAELVVEADLGGDEIYEPRGFFDDPAPVRFSLDGFPAGDSDVRLLRAAPAEPSAPGRLAWRGVIEAVAPAEKSLRFRISGTLRHATGRRGLFYSYVLMPFEAEAPELKFSIRPMDASSAPSNAIFGAVGQDLSFSVKLSPLSCSPGDLVTLEWELRGATAGNARPVPWKPGPGFKTYPPVLAAREDGLLRVTQVAIPLDAAATNAAAFSAATFDSSVGAWRDVQAGPWTLELHDRAAPEAVELPQLPERGGAAPAPPAAAADAIRSPGAANDFSPGSIVAVPVRVPARFAPSARALVLFDIPAGSRIELRELHGDWVRVMMPATGATGWIRSADFGVVSTSDTATP